MMISMATTRKKPVQSVPKVSRTSDGRQVTSGQLTIPLSVNRKNGDVEDQYREYLWPKIPIGFQRYSRKFVWVTKTTLRYIIIDVPAPSSGRKALMLARARKQGKAAGD